MATSVVPDLIDALVSRADVALPDLRVSDSWGVTDDPGDYLMVGVEDPDVQGYAESASVGQEWANANGTARNEEGDINCCAMSWNGDNDPKAARDAAYATVAAVEDLLRADPALGVSALLWTSFGRTQRLNQIQDGAGAVALVLFSIHFRARI